MHMPQEADTFNARQGSSPRQSIKLSARCDPTHHRQVVAGLEGTQDRSCGTRGIGANHSGQQVETRFVNEDGRAMLPPRFFFNSAQVSSRHSVIFSSLRWAARSLGFGGVQCKAFKRRDTWSLWYETANSRRMTCATRAAVQTSPRKPYASAPCDNNSGSWSRCCAVNFDAAPVCGRAARLSSPPVETRVIHWLTAPLVTPKASAISWCVQPSCLRSRARHRRRSFQSRMCACFAAMPTFLSANGFSYQCIAL